MQDRIFKNMEVEMEAALETVLLLPRQRSQN